MDDPYTRMFVPNKVKIMNVKVLNLMSGVKKTIFLVNLRRNQTKMYLIQSTIVINVNFDVNGIPSFLRI